MKSLLKKIVIFILNIETRLILRKYKPKLIGITGSVGKTSTKEAITAVVATKYRVRGSQKSYNSEFGVPLTVIGAPSGWGSLRGWLAVIYRGLVLVLFDHDYPDWLVLEVGADRPGDIRKPVKWIKFDVAVVTRLPDVPVHIEFFKDKHQVIEEKMALALSVRADGLVVLNCDDENIMAYRDRLKARVVTYGRSETATVRSAEEHISYGEQAGGRVPAGFAFKVDLAGNNLPVRISGAVGLHLVYPALAALTVGTELGVNPIDAIEALSAHVPPPGRLRIVAGMDGSTILDDTYNSSPAAVEVALKTLGEIDRLGRRIAVLGNMMELGAYAAEEHRKMGEQAAGVCDLIVTVGVRAKYAYDAVLAAGFAPEQIRHFNSSPEAGESLREIIGPGDIILVKGSQSARMEKVVEKIMAEPERKKELLVRQEKEWGER